MKSIKIISLLLLINLKVFAEDTSKFTLSVGPEMGYEFRVKGVVTGGLNLRLTYSFSERFSVGYNGNSTFVAPRLLDDNSLVAVYSIFRSDSSHYYVVGGGGHSMMIGSRTFSHGFSTMAGLGLSSVGRLFYCLETGAAYRQIPGGESGFDFISVYFRPSIGWRF